MRLSDSLRKLYVSDRRPMLLKYRSSTLFIALVVCFAIFTDIFLYGVIVPVIPFALSARANVPPEDVQHWTSILLAVYGAALLVASPLCGWLADRSGSRRAPLLGGLVVLAGSTIMLCLGRSVAVLVAGRIVQGLSAAVIWTVGLALLADTAGRENAGGLMGYVSIAYTMGVLVGPLLGGVVYASAGYYAVFYMTFAVITVDIVLRVVLVEKKIAKRWNLSTEIEMQDTQRQDNTAKDPASNRDRLAEVPDAPEQTSTPGRVSGLSSQRLPPVFMLLKSKRILAATWATFVTSILFCAFDATLPLYCHRIFGWNSLGGGLIFLAIIIPSFSGPVVGNICDKYGPRWPAALGLGLALPFWVLLRLVDHDSIRQIVLLCALLVLIGVCSSLVVPAAMAEFTYIVDAKERQQPGIFGPSGAYAQAYGIFNVAWAAGALLGPVWGGYVENAGGWGTMTWSLGVFSCISAVPVVLFMGGWISRRKHRSPAEPPDPVP